MRSQLEQRLIGILVDPWFNFRATKYLVANGFYDFWDWFDDRTWHPLGRVTGGTLYPGLMVTSGAIYHALRALTIPVDIRNICVLLAPGFSGLTAFATYLFTNEMTTSPSAGLLAAIFMGIAPGYISRSVAGSYDNEAIAIFLLVYTFYLWIKAVKLGSAFWGALCALFYGYMVSAWGGYVFITNLIPLHVFVLVAMGRFSPRLYVSYTTWYALGTLASMQIPFVGFLPVRSSEHMSALGTHLNQQAINNSTLILTVNRCFWLAPIGWVCRVYSCRCTKQAIPNTFTGIRLGCVCYQSARTCPPYRFWCHSALDGPFLLPLRYWLRQDPHTHYCICI